MTIDDGHSLISELPDDDDRTREVFARFGLTAYAAQVYEHQLVNLLNVAAASGRPFKRPAQVEGWSDWLFTQTAGRLLAFVSDAGHLPDADLDLCRRAVEERNRIVHDFFREHAVDFRTVEGMQRMVEDADVTRVLIRKADTAATTAMFKFGKEVGITPEAVDMFILAEREGTLEHFTLPYAPRSTPL